MTPPILQLPPELLLCIMDNLIICKRDWSPVWIPDCKSLLNLALTCRALCKLSLDRLYYHPAPLATTKPDSNITSLALTLYKNEARAKQVRKLTLLHRLWGRKNGCYRWADISIAAEDAQVLNQGCSEHDILGGYPRRLETVDPGKGVEQKAALYEIDDYNGSARYISKWRHSAWGALASLAIVKSPNLERLMMTVGRRMVPLAVREPGRLPGLTEVCWLPMKPGGFWIQDGALNWQVAAAPKLGKLALHNVARLHSMAPCSVTDLVLDRAVLDEASVRTLQRVFPLLQRLKLKLDAQVDGERDKYWRSTAATCAFVVDALARTYGESLCRLHLDCSGRILRDPAASRSLAGLRAMTALTELTLARPQDHHDYAPDDEKSFWAGVLPPNLEVLTVLDAGYRWKPMPLLSAIEELRPGKMREVIIKNHYDPCFVRLPSKKLIHLITYLFPLPAAPGQTGLEMARLAHAKAVRDSLKAARARW